MIQDERLLENLRYNLGDTIMNALGEDSVVEIDVNEDGKIWIEHLGEDMMYAGDLDASGPDGHQPGCQLTGSAGVC